MRQRNCLALFLLLILGSSCATLNIADIKQLDRTAFEPLDLRPDFETNDLRIDIIRSTISDTTARNDLPYHPLGFDLGNGLFYDLNENLTLRIDYLLGIADSNCYSINRFDNKNKKRPDYTFCFCHDTLTMSHRPFHLNRYVYHKIKDGSTISVMHRNHFQYAIRFTNNTMEYGGKKRAWKTIRMINDNEYHIDKGGRETYEMKEGKLYLDDDYIIELTNQNQTIQILSNGLIWDHILYTIEKDKDKMYLYDRQFHGQCIAFSKDGIIVYHDKSFQNKWTRQ